MPSRGRSLKSYKDEDLTDRDRSEMSLGQHDRHLNRNRSTPFERDVYADLSWIDPAEYESALRESCDLYRAGRNLDPNRPPKREEDMTDQDYSDMTLDEYRAAVASGQYDRHVNRRRSAVSNRSRMPPKAMDSEYESALPGSDQDYARMSHGDPRRAGPSGQYDRNMDRRHSTISKRSRMPSEANGSGSTSGGSSNRLGIRGSIKQAIIRKLGDPK